MAALRESSDSEAHKLAAGLRDALSEVNIQVAELQTELSGAEQSKQAVEQELKESEATLQLCRQADRVKKDQLQTAGGKQTELEEMIEERDVVLLQVPPLLTPPLLLS